MEEVTRNTYCTRYTNEDVFAFSDVHGDFLALITYLQDCAGVIKLSDGVDYFKMLENVKLDYKIEMCLDYDSNTDTNTYDSDTETDTEPKKAAKKAAEKAAIEAKKAADADYCSEKLYEIINDDKSKYDSTYGFEWCGGKSLVVITVRINPDKYGHFLTYIKIY
jgi:hypothetical protein